MTALLITLIALALLAATVRLVWSVQGLLADIRQNREETHHV